jgi:hypothetical protein
MTGAGIDLYWLPLGVGGHSVRLNGLVFEAIAARLQHRDRSDLYHSALEVHLPDGRFVIEQAPARARAASADASVSIAAMTASMLGTSNWYTASERTPAACC